MASRRPAAPLLAVLLLAASMAAASAAADDLPPAIPPLGTWSDCSGGLASFKVSDVTLDPSPVKPGDTAQFLIKAEAGADVAEGSVVMIVHYGGMPIWTQVDNLCDKAECPIKQGPTEVRYTQLFPIITPPGAYTVSLNGRSGDQVLFCVSVDFQVVPPGASQLAHSWAAALQGGGGGEQEPGVLSVHRKALA